MYFIILYTVNNIVKLYLNANYFLHCIERTEKREPKSIILEWGFKRQKLCKPVYMID